MRRWLSTFLLLSLIIFLVASPALAQSYYFQMPKETVDAYWNSDGTLSLDYTIIFNNNPSGHIIEYVDLGLPNSNYSESNITASVDGNPVTDISSSGFQGEGCCGVAIGLGSYAIAPGSTGTFKAHVDGITGVLYPDSENSSYASAVFAPSYFNSAYVDGSTDLIVTFHLPPGIQPEEPKYHAAPDGFPSAPDTANDAEGRVIYIWENTAANGYTAYLFGASFPASYVPSDAVVQPPPPPSSSISFTGFANFLSAVALPVICIGGFFVFIIVSIVSNRNRKQAYLPPKISIEGHGIKRGLTAVEAAILLEQPLDKVMTMILFSAVKKNAAEVVTRDPLDIKVNQPIPDDLQPYEKDFLTAFQKKDLERRKALRDMVINLVKNVSEKMKGFSRTETVAYYTDIIKRAWEQVEAANTPEVKSQKYEEVMEWTMLDKHYGDRTQEVFRNMPVFIPTWWGHYDPGLGRVSTGGASMPSVGTGRIPGSDFAASVVAGVNTFSTKAVGNITDFTSSITSVTNPAPKPTSGGYKGGSGGHGCACACACACAGCACACAGGGR